MSHLLRSGARKPGASFRHAVRMGRTAATTLVVALMLVAPASAHRRETPDGAGAGRGVLLPAVAHHEMRIVATYRAPILDLAARQRRTDEPFRRILNFQNIQFAYCAWGLAPASVTDEDSPFNECSHAYLSATKALLLKIRDMPDGGTDAETLTSELEHDIQRAAPLICRFGGEPFDTAHVVYPDWRMAAGHLPTMAAGLSMALTPLGFGLLLVGARHLRRPRRTARQTA